MTTIRPLLFAMLTLASMFATGQSATNTPPSPGNNAPPVTCSTGSQGHCDHANRAYLLRNCPVIGTEAGNPEASVYPTLTKVICAEAVDPPLPYMECQQFPGYVICDAYPSGADELIFQWTAAAQLRAVTITILSRDSRKVKISCTNSWSGRIDLRVTNSLTGDSATDFANVSCQVPVSDIAED